MEKYPVITKLNLESRTMFGGLLALSLTSLAILATKTEIDAPIMVGIYCFAIAIPCLAFCTERVRIDSQYQMRTHSIWIDVVEGCGIFGSIIGFGAIFWHFSVHAAVVFGVVCFGVNALHVWYSDAMENLNEGTSDESGDQ